MAGWAEVRGGDGFWRRREGAPSLSRASRPTPGPAGQPHACGGRPAPFSNRLFLTPNRLEMIWHNVLSTAVLKALSAAFRVGERPAATLEDCRPALKRLLARHSRRRRAGRRGRHRL